MYFVNVVKMKIPITIFICISISSARSTESNSSLFESKVVGGKRGRNLFGVQYAGFIILASNGNILTSVAFINERNCFVARRWAVTIDENYEHYHVESQNLFGKKPYPIDSVYYTREDYFVAAEWGVVKLKKGARDRSDYISFVNPRSTEFYMTHLTYAGGWTYDDSCTAYLVYLEIELLPAVLCSNEIIKHYGRNLQNLVCGRAKNGYFYNIEEGAGLFVDSKNLLGVTVKPALELGDISIFALVYNDEKFIHRFVSKAPKPLTAKDKNKGKSPEGSGSTQSASAIEEGTLCFSNMNPMYPAQMYPYDQSKMRGYGSSYTDTQHHGSMDGYGTSYIDTQHHGSMGGYGSSYMDPSFGGSMGGYNQGSMGGYGQNPTGTHHQSDSDSYYPSQTSSQSKGDLDDSEVNMPFLRPITIGRRRSASTQQNDGSHSPVPLHRMIQNINIKEENAGVPESVRLTGVRSSVNPRIRNSNIQEDARVPETARLTGTRPSANPRRKNSNIQEDASVPESVRLTGVRSSRNPRRPNTRS